jgi:hypothetical protein
MTRRPDSPWAPYLTGGLLIALLISVGLSFAYIALICIGMIWTYLRRRDDGDNPPSHLRNRPVDPVSPDTKREDIKIPRSKPS